MSGIKANTPPVKTIILSAGQGRRLLPLTKNAPKCLLPISGKPIIEWEIDALLACGIVDVTVVTGFESSVVEDVLQQRYANRAQVNTIFNPFFEVADNLVSCWIARSAMNQDFLLLNGDTIFDPEVLTEVLSSKPAPITLCVNQKSVYDADDMKVQLDKKGCVKHVSKTLPVNQIDAESIGLVFFRQNGPQLFCDAIENALRHQDQLRSWYFTIIDALAGKQMVKACSVSEHRWCEVDVAADLAIAEELFGRMTPTQRCSNTPVN
jgi:choline kinase